MSIRWQNIFAIVPIFLAVGLASSWLRLKSDETEMLWGLREQSAGVAAAVAAFLDGNRWEELEKPGADTFERLHTQLGRLYSAGSARQLFGLSIDGQRVVFNNSPMEWRKLRPAIEAEALDAIKRGESYSTEILTESDGSARLISYAAVKGGDGSLRGIVGTVVSADDFTRAWKAALRQAGWLCAGVTGLGLLIALTVSSVFCARLRELKGAAERLAKGDYTGRVEPGVVRELSDLTDTFNTVGSILEELANKARHTLVEAEQFRSDEDLEAAFCERCYPPAWREAGSIQIAGRLANDRCAGDFFEIFEGRGGTYALLGRIDGGSPAERITSASAAHAMSRELLLALGAEEAIRRVRENFTVSHWQCIFCDEKSEKIRQWLLREDGALECRDLGTPDTPRLFHSISDKAAANVELYARCVPGVRSEELLDEIAPLLRGETQGATLVVGH